MGVELDKELIGIYDGVANSVPGFNRYAMMVLDKDNKTHWFVFKEGINSANKFTDDMKPKKGERVKIRYYNRYFWEIFFLDRMPKESGE
jgi:hypothetical protein